MVYDFDVSFDSMSQLYFPQKLKNLNILKNDPFSSSLKAEN